MQTLIDSEREQQDGKATLKRRLGRGLNALLGSAEDHDAAAVDVRLDHARAEAVAPASDEVSIELIDRNPFQPRKNFDEESLLELVASISRHGILQALLVRPHGHGYQLIAGERRLLAAQKAGLETVPCRVVTLDDCQVCEAAIEENLKRRDLNVLEKAQAFQDYLERFDSTIEQLATRLSMNRSTVSNLLRLLDLPDAVKDALTADQISAGHARALLALDGVQQAELCDRIQRERLSVRAVEQAVRTLLQPESAEQTAAAPAREKPEPSNHVLSLQDQLRQQMGTRVEIQLKSEDSGRVVIHFGSNEEFEHILMRLRSAA